MSELARLRERVRLLEERQSRMNDALGLIVVLSERFEAIERILRSVGIVDQHRIDTEIARIRAQDKARAHPPTLEPSPTSPPSPYTEYGEK